LYTIVDCRNLVFAPWQISPQLGVHGAEGGANYVMRVGRAASTRLVDRFYGLRGSGRKTSGQQSEGNLELRMILCIGRIGPRLQRHADQGCDQDCGICPPKGGLLSRGFDPVSCPAEPAAIRFPSAATIQTRIFGIGIV
jgi:hypothetical protein